MARERKASGDFAWRLLRWYDEHGRHDLPWKRAGDVYHIWLSEIMLQQTQVGSVIPYFNRFITRFANLEALANATQDEVMSLWAGLGYYARARNLHRAAQICLDVYEAKLPDDFEQLNALPGIGRSTAGAILAMARGQRHPILDGNVKRVLCRHREVYGWPGARKTEKALWRHAEELTPEERVGDYTQAIMDLGSTLCRRAKPNCESCPVAADCIALEKELQQTLPEKKPKQQKLQRSCWMFVLQDQQDNILLEKRPQVGIWGGLWSFPQRERQKFAQCPPSDMIDEIQAELPPDYTLLKEYASLSAFVHVFSHYSLEIHPLLFMVGKSDKTASGVSEPTSAYNNSAPRKEKLLRWVPEAKIKEKTIGIPAAVEKILSTYRNEEQCAFDFTETIA